MKKSLILLISAFIYTVMATAATTDNADSAYIKMPSKSTRRKPRKAAPRRICTII